MAIQRGTVEEFHEFQKTCDKDAIVCWRWTEDGNQVYWEVVEPPPPKEPRYRRKPLDWVLDEFDPSAPWLVAKTPVSYLERVYLNYEPGNLFSFNGCEPCTIEEAKARVEAEITRRLASVLEVCDENV